MSRSGFRRLALLSFISVLGINSLLAQAGKSQAGDQSTPTDTSKEAVDPLKRPVSEKQRKENAKSLRQELSKETKAWYKYSGLIVIHD